MMTASERIASTILALLLQLALWVPIFLKDAWKQHIFEALGGKLNTLNLLVVIIGACVCGNALLISRARRRAISNPACNKPLRSKAVVFGNRKWSRMKPLAGHILITSLGTAFASIFSWLDSGLAFMALMACMLVLTVGNLVSQIDGMRFIVTLPTSTKRLCNVLILASTLQTTLFLLIYGLGSAPILLPEETVLSTGGWMAGISVLFWIPLLVGISLLCFPVILMASQRPKERIIVVTIYSGLLVAGVAILKSNRFALLEWPALVVGLLLLPVFARTGIQGVHNCLESSEFYKRR